MQHYLSERDLTQHNKMSYGTDPATKPTKPKREGHKMKAFQTMTPPRSVIERQRLRAALRSNSRATDVLKGRQVNDLNKADLEQALRDLGLDPVTIAAEIPAQAQAQAQPMTPRPMTPRPRPMTPRPRPMAP
jgi:hypothetical protein